MKRLTAIPNEKGAGMNIDETVKYFQSHGVKCKKVEDDSPEYGDFIAIFSYGDLGDDKIMEHIRENNLLCIQFKSAIYENERKKGDHNGDIPVYNIFQKSVEAKSVS